MRDPSGRLVTAGSTSQQAGRADAKTRPTSPNAITAAGSGCAYRTTNQYFCHAGAYQYVTSDGAYMSTPVQSPPVGTADYHSLAELAVQSADGQQIIEIGWRV